MRMPGQIGVFLSLKWKALSLTSLVLVMVTSAFISLNYLELQSQFVERRENLQTQYAIQVQALLDQFSTRLLQLSTVLASMQSTQLAFEKFNQKIVSSHFNPLSSSLELNMGIETMAIISAAGKKLAMHGRGEKFDLPRSVYQAVNKSIATENPVVLIDCSISCLQYVVAPVLGASGVKGALVLGASLADVVLGFKGVSGTDIGLLVETQAPALESPYWLGIWGAKVVALTNAAQNLPLLRHVSKTEPSLASLGEPLDIAMQNQQYQIRLFPLAGFSQADKGHLAIIADITGAVRHIREATKRSVYIAVAGLLLSELLLLLVLWAPMSRLRRSAENLPLLAEGAFATVRAAISGNRRRRFFNDEVDVLNETAIFLSHQLEALNAEVARRTQDLSERMEEITREKNFVTNVLDTAQVIILTQNCEHDILMINPYGQKLTGYGLAELQGRRFFSLLKHQGAGTEITAYLNELVEGKLEHFELEADIECKGQDLLNIVWQHSRLLRQAHEGPAILSVGMDITARKKAEMRLAWLADHDPLTGLFNRRRFEKELELAIASAKRYRHTGGLLFFDLDQFKYVNDTSGHGAGDRLLVVLSGSLPSLLREVDIIGRLGGDEFGVILSHANAEEAVAVARKILAHINAMQFPVGDRVHKISASIGVALFPEHGSEVQDLLARTDLAMYHVKESGRGGWYLLHTDDQSHHQMQERVLWKQRVENALAEDRFVLFAQPIVDIQTGLTRHWEVLLRMRGEDGGLIGPAHFIEVAETTGLIHSIDRMVLTGAAAHLALMNGCGREITLTVNLSAHAFNDPDLLGHLKKAIADNGLNPRQIIFEMTETAAVSDIGPARRLMESINEIGCLFALDDFGTGFSSFDYLRQLPFEYIKIDGSFIRHLSSRPDDQVLVKAMVDIARAFNKKTIAEQVEDAQTLALLKEYGVDYSQGYYTGRPAPIAEAIR